MARIAKLRIAEGHLANVIQTAIIPIDRFMLTGTLAIGVYLALSSKDSAAVAQIFIFLLLSQRIVGPLRQMAQLLEQYEEAKSSVNLVSGLVNAGSEDERSGRGVRQPLTGHIEFASVRFQYSGANSPALDRVSFELPPGTTLGVMGAAVQARRPSRGCCSDFIPTTTD